MIDEAIQELVEEINLVFPNWPLPKNVLKQDGPAYDSDEVALEKRLGRKTWDQVSTEDWEDIGDHWALPFVCSKALAYYLPSMLIQVLQDGDASIIDQISSLLGYSLTGEEDALLRSLTREQYELVAKFIEVARCLDPIRYKFTWVAYDQAIATGISAKRWNPPYP